MRRIHAIKRYTAPSPFPTTADLTTAGAPIGSTTSGLTQLAGYPNTLSFVNQWQAAVGSIDFQGIHVLDNKSLVIGTATPFAVLPNQSALEIDMVAGQVGIVISQFGADSASVEPWIFYRSRGADYTSPAAVQASDSLGVIQFQGRDAAGTANVAAANIGGRVQGGSTPGSGNSRALPGNLFFAVAPGDGTTPIGTALEVLSTKNVNVLGNILMGGVLTVDTAGVIYSKAFRTDRVAIANNGVLIIQPYGGSTALITLLSTNTAGTAAPAGCFAFRVDIVTAPQIGWSIGTSAIALATGVLTGTTGASGKFTLSTDGAGNGYLENRTGSSRTYTRQTISGAA